MTNDQRNDNLPVASSAAFDIAAIWQRTQDLTDKGVEEFPSFGTSTGLFSNILVGVPFIFVSEAVERTLTGGKFGDQHVAQAYISLLDDEWSLQPARLATFTGAYLVPRLLNATRNELVGSYVFTIWPHPTFVTAGDKPPLMLKRYKAGDMPPSVEENDVWAGGEHAPTPNSPAAQTARARIQEIESAGPVPPPWEPQATGPAGPAGHTRRVKP